MFSQIDPLVCWSDANVCWTTNLHFTGRTTSMLPESNISSVKFTYFTQINSNRNESALSMFGMKPIVDAANIE